MLKCRLPRVNGPLYAIGMRKLLFTILVIFTVCRCTYHQVDLSQEDPLSNISISQTLLEDSIDRYGLSGCVKPSGNELNASFIKALDSAWKMLLVEGQTNKRAVIYSKAKLKESLLANNFTVESSGERITATKKGFNERWWATWDKDSNFVRLTVTRWHRGYTYAFMMGRYDFDK